jgi:hypothetical protein
MRCRRQYYTSTDKCNINAVTGVLYPEPPPDGRGASACMLNVHTCGVLRALALSRILLPRDRSCASPADGPEKPADGAGNSASAQQMSRILRMPKLQNALSIVRQKMRKYRTSYLTFVPVY